MADESESEEKETILQRLAAIPCLRDSYLTGIAGGMMVGAIYFLFTSNVRLSPHVGFGGYMVITLGTWGVCRYRFSKHKEQADQLSNILRRYKYVKPITDDT